MKRWLRIGVSGTVTGTASSRRARSAGTVVGIVLALVSAIEPGPRCCSAMPNPGDVGSDLRP
jgi:hypothetical protein